MRTFKYARIGIVLAACGVMTCWGGDKGAGDGKPREAPPDFHPVASVQEVMLTQVNPSATYLWNAVSTVSSSEGTVDKRPTSDADWLEARHQALLLIEAGNLLLIKGRAVVAQGATVKDAELPGILGPEQITKAIARSRQRFKKLVYGLQSAAQKSLSAIEHRDVDALSNAGEGVDEACEACHQAYWYPAAPR